METLQIIWFLLIGILIIGYAILDGFDLGTGFWHIFASNEKEREGMIKGIAPFWDGNEVWLLTGGGAIFAAFPPVYATTFSAFYLALMLVLTGLIFRAVSIDFRNKLPDSNWKLRWDILFSIGSMLPALLYGVAVGNVIKGMPLDQQGNYLGTFFQLLNPYALLVGITGFLMMITQSAYYLSYKMSEELSKKAKIWASISSKIYGITLIFTGIFSIYFYRQSSIIVPAIFLLLTIALLFMAYRMNHKDSELRAFMFSSLSVATHLLAVAFTAFPYLVPTSNFAEGLTIYNSSSSQYTLTVMLIFALLGMPLVIGYTIYIYKMFAGKISLNNL